MRLATSRCESGMLKAQKKMNRERLQRLEELYHGAREKEPADREAYLTGKCGGEIELHLRDRSGIAFSRALRLGGNVGSLDGKQ